MRRLLIPLCLVALVAAGCGASSGSPSKSAPAAATPPAQETKAHRLASGLVYVDVQMGVGKMAEPGTMVSVNYTGRLMDGTEFDGSSKRGVPYTFQLGAGSVIQGWEQGIRGMRIGGKRRLTVPPDLGYGARGFGGGVIPPNATLDFDIELVDVK